MQKKLIVFAGPTASGKTALAIQLAQHFNTEILSFDSRQCYKELNIGVAKPSIAELTAVPHHFINSHSITDNLTAALFEKYAFDVLQNLFKKNNTIIAVGGTGLYLNALLNGLDDIPTIPTDLRISLQQQYDTNGIDWLKNTIQKLDKSFTDNNDLHNAHRMLRALEVIMHTGNSIKHYQCKEKVERPFTTENYCIAIDREALYQRINTRVDIMIKNGLVEEVKQLVSYKNYNALQTVGYAELFSFFDGEINLVTAIEKIKQHTRNYAKRQITWFKKDTSMQLLSAEAIIKKIIYP